MDPQSAGQACSSRGGEGDQLTSHTSWPTLYDGAGMRYGLAWHSAAFPFGEAHNDAKEVAEQK